MSTLHENCTSVQHGPKPLKTIISDAGIYCYCAISALSLHELFPDEWDRPFCQNCLTGLIRHLDLPKQVESSMKALMDEPFVDIDAFVTTLKEESSLKGNCLRVIEDLILFAIEGGTYDARMRVLIRHIAWLLKVALPLMEIYEESVVEMLSRETHEQTEEDNQDHLRRQRNKKIKRYFMIGLATLGGGAVMGLTGGLAAPFVAAGAGAIIGGAGAAALGSAAGIAVIGSLFGVAGAGLTGYKMKKRVGAIEEFAFDSLTEGQQQLHITLAVSGWLNVEGPESFQTPWQTLMNSREQYCLRYESSYLLELGQAMDYLFSFALSMAAQEALKYTILSGIISAIAWPATLITVAGIIDNPWGVCIRRSAEVGKHLAEVLLARQQGRRPVTLVGFSLGARVIFYCLQEMAKRKGCEGIIEDVVLLGAPVGAHLEGWRPLAKVVSGRIVNGYCRDDWLLKFLYRTSSATLKIAGLQPIKWDNRKMFNVDLSDVVTGHMDYANKIDIILKAVGVQTRDELPDALRKSQSDYATSATYRAAAAAAAHKKLPRSKSDTQLHYHCTALFPRLVSRDMNKMSISDESLASRSVSPSEVPSLASLQSFHSSTSPRLSPHKFVFSDNYNKPVGSKTSSSVSSGNWEWDSSTGDGYEENLPSFDPK